jgi:signal transduction histidine kinase/CheY-like chemotaxis protein
MNAIPGRNAYSRQDYDSEVRRRILVVACVALTVLALLLMAGTDLLGWPWDLIPISALAVVSAIGGMALASRFPWPALALITAVCAGIIAFVAGHLGYQEVLLLLCAPVALATILGGVAGGAGGAMAASGLIVWQMHPLTTNGGLLTALAILLAWAPVTLLGVYRWTALDVIDWAWASSLEMRASLDDALAQRVVLKQTQEDLVQANLQLERLSERLTMMTRIAEEARQAKETFLASVSHELRTPLNMIIGFSEMITESPEVYDRALPLSLLADIAVIQRNSQHLASLVDDILDLSRTDAGRMALSKEWTALGDIVEAAVVAVRPLFDSKGLSLTVGISPSVPPIYCDRTRVRQVILNLLSNAGRFTAAGGVEIRVVCEDGWVLCSVADTGPGIAPEDRDRVFEPFQQANSSILRRTDGSGLGLSISKRFVEMHGGQIWLESEVGQGTTVSFRLPVEETSVRGARDVSRWFGPDTQHEVRDRPSRAPLPAIRPRFVVVESSQVMQRMLRRYYYDAEIVHVGTVQKAAEALAESPAASVILNDANAEAVLGHVPSLADFPQGTPALVCWAPSERELAERLGVLHYLVKPIDRHRLVALVDELGDAVSKVLIVDDDHEAVQLLARMLLSAPRRYEVLRATRAQRALTLMRRNHPDLVLLDLVMPEMDGYQFLQARQNDAYIRDIPIIAITGQVASAAFAEGRCVTLVRPPGVPLADLLGRILAATGEMTSPPLQPADREPPERPGA